MFGDMLGPSTLELAQKMRAWMLDALAHRRAMFEFLEEKGVIEGQADWDRYFQLVARAESAVDQLIAECEDDLRKADTPEGERFRTREELAKSFNELLGLFEVTGQSPGQNGELSSSGEEQETES